MLNHTAPPGHEKTARAGSAGGTEARARFKHGTQVYCPKVGANSTFEQSLSSGPEEWLQMIEGQALDMFRPGAMVAVAREIAARVNASTGAAAVSMPDLSEAAGAGPCATRRAIRALVALGLLTLDRGDGRGLRTVYVPQMPRGGYRV